MKKNYFFTIAAILFVVFSVNAQNLVLNGDLEAWDDDNTPTSWTKIESITKEAVNIHGGSFSAAHMSNEGTTDFSQNVQGIVGGQQYRIQYYYLDNVTNARTRIWAYWADASGTTISDNGDVLRPGTYSEDNSEWMHYDVTLVAPATAAQFKFEVRVYKQDGTWDGYVYYDDFSVEANVTNDPEPSNYPTAFTATSAGLTISLSWADAVGDDLPLGYLIKGYELLTTRETPVDGVPEADDLDWSDMMATVNVGYGTETYSFSNLNSGSSYSFEIFPYSNSGENIDYKTDGDVPTAFAEVASFIIINQENFDVDLGTWSEYSVIGDQVWAQASYGDDTYAKMSGYDGQAYENEDWLISPLLNLASFDSVFFSFTSAYNYDGPHLELQISNDYDGSGNPNDFTWTDISDMAVWSPGGWAWTESENVDLKDYLQATTYLACKFTSNTDGSSTWEMATFLVFGYNHVGIGEKAEATVSVYPNPTVDFVYVDADTEGSVKIYSISGQLLIDEPVNEGVNNIDINALSQGTYLLQFSNAKGNSSTKKLIVR